MNRFDVNYNNNRIEDNQFLSIYETQNEPKISYKCNNNELYTIFMYDPDSVFGNRFHWILINIPCSNINNGDIILPYIGPSPPTKTGMHRYTFELYKQRNKIQPFKINDRNISIHDVKKQFDLTELIPEARKQFLSQNRENVRQKRKQTNTKGKQTNKKGTRKRKTRRLTK